MVVEHSPVMLQYKKHMNVQLYTLPVALMAVVQYRTHPQVTGRRERGRSRQIVITTRGDLEALASLWSLPQTPLCADKYSGSEWVAKLLTGRVGAVRWAVISRYDCLFGDQCKAVPQSRISCQGDLLSSLTVDKAKLQRRYCTLGLQLDELTKFYLFVWYLVFNHVLGHTAS